jgi:hypothetical protein
LTGALYFGKAGGIGGASVNWVTERRILAHTAALSLWRLNNSGGPTKTRVSLPRLVSIISVAAKHGQTAVGLPGANANEDGRYSPRCQGLNRDI